MTEDAKPLDLYEEFAKKTPVQTSQGTVYARPLGNGRWSSISGSADAATLGKAALRALTGPKEKTGNETALRDDVFERLSPDDLQNLASAVANANQLGDLPAGKTPIDGLGELILKRRNELIDQARSSTLLGNAGLFHSPTAPNLNMPDYASMPGNRTAAASEQAAELIAEGLRLWQQQLEANKQAAAESKAQSEKNLAVAQDSLRTARRTMVWTVGLALVALAVQIGLTLWTERGSAEERTKQAETERLRHEATIQVLREQLSAQQQLISQKSPTPPKKSQASKN